MENIETIEESKFLEFYNSRSYEANCFNEDDSLNKNYNSFKSTGIIAQILDEHWENAYIKNKDLIDKYSLNDPIEIQKVIDCYNKNLDCSLYECPHSHDIVFTIPKQLRKYFFYPFERRINILFKAVNKTIYSILNEYFKRNKKAF